MRSRNVYASTFQPKILVREVVCRGKLRSRSLVSGVIPNKFVLVQSDWNSLCTPSVSSVSVVFLRQESQNHRDTEGAQRKPALRSMTLPSKTLPS
jgi:hypothetical protein